MVFPVWARVGVIALAVAGCSKGADAPRQANVAEASPDEAPPSAPASKAGQVDHSHRGEPAPAAALTDLAGKPATLAPAGKPLLVNLWATWCAPCVAELPTLDKAAAAVATVALNQGEDAGKVGPFLAARKLANVRPLLDPGMGMSLKLAANLPTTILYDGQGREVWRVSGDRDWSSPESAQLIAEAG